MDYWKEKVLEVLELARDLDADDLKDVAEYMGRIANDAPFPELKDCPFCGEPHGRLIAHQIDYKSINPTYSVECELCGASTRRIAEASVHDVDFDCLAARQAIKLWNRRNVATPGKK